MQTIVHKIGNKVLDEGVAFSDEQLQLDENTAELLQNYFLSSFKGEETFHFYSESYLENNLMYNAVSLLFSEPLNFIERSKDIGRLLYDAAENPRVQSGELFIAYFKAQTPEDIDKIGIFKVEKRESFLKIKDSIEVDKGVSLTRIDKAALIFNIDKETGYVVQAVDNNKNGDMYYWFEDFLKIKQRTDDFYQTQETLSIFKDYIKKQLPVEFEVTKVDQADFLNKSLAFFKENEEFKLDDFTQKILEDESLIESFNTYKNDYEQEMQVSLSEEFNINSTAVKKAQKHFKSIIKLDKNFHIYIHGDRKLLQEGSDENGKYYKLYFENEN